MKIYQIAAFTGTLILSSAVLAESGGDITFARMMEARDVAMERYAAREVHRENEPMVASDAKDKDEAADKE